MGLHFFVYNAFWIFWDFQHNVGFYDVMFYVGLQL